MDTHVACSLAHPLARSPAHTMAYLKLGYGHCFGERSTLVRPRCCSLPPKAVLVHEPVPSQEHESR